MLENTLKQGGGGRGSGEMGGDLEAVLRTCPLWILVQVSLTFGVEVGVNCYGRPFFNIDGVHKKEVRVYER